MTLRLVPVALAASLAVFAAGARGQQADPADGEPDAGLRAAWSELFAQPRPASADEQLRAVLDAIDYDPARLRALIAADTTYPAFAAGWRSANLRLDPDGTDPPVQVHLRMPEGYTPEKSWPLILALHGQNSDGRKIAQQVGRLLGDAAERYVLVAPDRTGASMTINDELLVAPRMAMDYARRRMNIDDDRMYVLGYSQGGHLTWNLATFWPRRFAAAVAMAGMPVYVGFPHTTVFYVANLDNQPFWAIWGRKDTPANPDAVGPADMCRLARRRLKELENPHFKATELPDVGHFGCYPEEGELPKYLAAHRRNLLPDAFRRSFHTAGQVRAYYVEAVELANEPLDFSKKLQVRIRSDHRPTAEEVQKAKARFLRKTLYYFRAERHCDDNALLVRAGGAKKLRVYCYDGLLDPSRPVTVRYWSRKWTGRLPVSARCMLEHYAASRDQTGLVLNELDLSIRGRVVFRYKSGPGQSDPPADR